MPTPTAPHPTAKALFDALEETLKKKDVNNDDNDRDCRGDRLHTEEARGGDSCALMGHPPQKRISPWLHKRSLELGWRNRHHQSKEYPFRIDGIEFSVEQKQRGEVEGTYGTGATVWPASVVLMKYLERHKDRLLYRSEKRNEIDGGIDVDDVGSTYQSTGAAIQPCFRVADLGAGTGVTSLATAILLRNHPKARIVCTDGCENVVNLAKSNVESVCRNLRSDLMSRRARTNENAEKTYTSEDMTSDYLNLGKTTLEVCQYWWGDGSLQPIRSYDLILVSDCILPKLYPIAPLVEAIDELLEVEGAVKVESERQFPAAAIISYEHRFYPSYDPRHKFQELAAAKDLVVTVIPWSDHDPVYSADDIEVWEVHRKQKY